jgi:hypothetical protein
MGQLIASALCRWTAPSPRTTTRRHRRMGAARTRWTNPSWSRLTGYLRTGSKPTRGPVQAAVAKAQAIAGEGTVAVTAGTIARQCLELGLLDAIAIDLVFPVTEQSSEERG